MNGEQQGRGEIATMDMKARIAALQTEGVDVIDELWDRNRDAVLGDGLRYEYAEEPSNEA